jgi:integral membrane protein
MKSTVIAQLRTVGKLEGSSFLLLLGVAMPLKYLAGLPLAVKIMGMVHGILFVVFALALVQAKLVSRWPIGRALLLMGAAVLPFGPFVADRWLRQEQAAATVAARSPALP